MKRLFLLFIVKGVLSQSRAILLETKLFTTRLTFERVVVIATFFTDEEDGLCFFLTFGHNWALEINVYRCL